MADCWHCRVCAATRWIRLCAGQRAWIAIAIGEEEFVIGGEDGALAKLGKEFSERGAKLTPLKVGLASHTPLLSDAVQPFRALLNASSLTAPATPVVAGIDAAWVVRRETAIEKLALQLDHTIAWSGCLDMLYERGCRVFLELGPGRALARMTQARFDDVDARAVDDFRSLDGVSSWLSKHTRSLVNLGTLNRYEIRPSGHPRPVPAERFCRRGVRGFVFACVGKAAGPRAQRNPRACPAGKSAVRIVWCAMCGRCADRAYLCGF